METRFFSLTGYVIGATSLTVEDTIDLLLGESRFEMQQLFTGGRMPNVVVATDGMVLATWGATEAIGNRWWDKGLQVRRSEDGGKTWGDPITIANPGWQGGGLTVDEATGDVLAFVEAHHPPASLTVYRSTDHGKTWQPQETVVHPDRNDNVPSMHMAEHGITLRHGEQKGRLLRPARTAARTSATTFCSTTTPPSTATTALRPGTPVIHSRRGVPARGQWPSYLMAVSTTTLAGTGTQMASS